MTHWTYRSGLQELGNGCYAYLQPDGSWGWSNAGLITDGDASLLVDTLFDLRLTRQMLGEMRRAAPAAASIDRVVNTHANGDHCWGNQLVDQAEIIATRKCAEEMKELPPGKAALLMKVTRLLQMLGGPGKLLTRGLGGVGLAKARDLGDAADFVQRIFAPYEWRGIRLVLPTRTFEGELQLRVGDKEVQLLEAGPAHTLGDAMVHVPADRTIYTGDILFMDAHPIVWEGPVSNWIAACERIDGLDVETVVPGHGPITDKAGVRRVRDYLVYLDAEVRARHAAGMTAEEAATDISFADFNDWTERERIIINVQTIYREITGSRAHPDSVASFACMARFNKSRGVTGP